MTYLNDERIKNFLEHVNKQLYTETEANDISSELLDHLECLIEDYLDAGYDEDHAISKALKQMGDPKEIGYSFTDFEGLKQRKRIMLFFKVTSFLVFSMTMLVLMFNINASEETSVLDLASILSNILFVFFTITSGTYFIGTSSKLLSLDTTPELIIWPYKQKVQWEYFIIGFFFMPIFLIFLWLYFLESGVNMNSLLGMWPMVTFVYSIWAFFYSEKFRIPKYMIIKEGILVKSNFISWAGIVKYHWRKNFNAKDQYTLVIETFNQNYTGLVRKKINVHHRQKHHVNQMLIERT